MDSAVNLSKKTVNLTKGQRINLSKECEGIRTVMVGLGWDPAEDTRAVEPKGFLGKLKAVFGKTSPSIPRANIDCDAWVVALDANNKPVKLVYYGDLEWNMQSFNLIRHMGDNLTGDGDGDDEVINIDLTALPPEVERVVVGVTIYDCVRRNQTFDSISNLFIRVVDTSKRDSSFEVCRYADSSFGALGATTFIAGDFSRNGREWQFEAVGKATQDRSIQEAVKALSL